MPGGVPAFGLVGVFGGVPARAGGTTLVNGPVLEGDGSVCGVAPSLGLEPFTFPSVCDAVGFPGCSTVLPPWFKSCLQWTLASNEPGLTFSWILLQSRLAPGLYSTTICVHNCLPLASMPNANDTPMVCVTFQTTWLNCAAFCARSCELRKLVRHISSYLAKR